VTVAQPVAAGDDRAGAPPVLELRDVSAGYGPFRAIFGVSLEVRRGHVLALLGANGAGKTTIARVCSGLVPVSSGHLLVDGVDVTGARAWRLARMGIVHAPEGRSVFSSLTVEENLTLEFRRSVGRAQVGAALARAYELFPRLGERRRQVAGTLSGGEQRMLSLARVLVHPPRLLIVDELSLGLAPIIVDEVYELLARIRDAGASLLIIEQYVGHALSVADEIALLRHGEVVYRGDAADVGEISQRLLS
jgi:branched-chain amino acid transport system ATP-binding protein